jgi:ribosomal protein L15E
MLQYTSKLSLVQVSNLCDENIAARRRWGLNPVSKKPAKPKSPNLDVLNSRKASLGSKKRAKPKSPNLDVLNSRKAALGS